MRQAWASLGVTAAVGLVAAAGASAAPLASGVDRGSRITVGASGGSGVSATAVHGDTLYLGGEIGGIGLRAPGLAVMDATSGALRRQFAELDGAARDTVADATKVVPDGQGGAYVLGVRKGADGIRQSGVLHVETNGDVDLSFRPRIRDADADPTLDVRDAALSADGRTLYVAGAFAEVGGQSRDGLAALDAETGAVKPWEPQVEGPGGNPARVDKVAVAGSQLLVAGVFERIGSELRSGIGGVSLADASATQWAPAGLSATDAAVALLVDGTTAYLVAARAGKAVTTGDSGTPTDLALAANQNIRAAAIANGRMYVVGSFSSIGGRTRAGLAEVDLSAPAPAVTDWNPGATGDVRGQAIAVDADNVYVAILSASTATGRAWGGRTRCGVAAARRDASAAVTDWDPRLGSGTACNRPPAWLAVSGGNVWATGNFTAANQQIRNGLAAIDVREDQILSWAPDAGATDLTTDLAVAPDGETVYGVGFGTALNGQPRNGAWAVAAGPGAGSAQQSADVRAWAPELTGTVTALALDLAPGGQSISRVYIGGAFDTVGGDPRFARLAAVRPDDGAAIVDWAPAPNASVTDLELGGDGTLYVAGNFTMIGSTQAPRNHLAALTGASDNPTGWDPLMAAEAGGTVLDLAVTVDVVYAAGTFNGTVGGQTRRGVAALRRADGNAVASWDPQPDGPVSTVSVSADGTAYLIGGDPDSGQRFVNLGAQSRPAGLAAVTADGTVTGWAPQSQTFESASGAASTEVREVGGKVVVPGTASGGVDGVPQYGAFVFAAAQTPQVLDRPVVTGTPSEGEQLTCEPGTYGLDSYVLSYRWLRNDESIEDATGATYLIEADDRGAEIVCEENAENAAGRVTATSDPLAIEALRPVNEEPPSIDGDVRVGVEAFCARGSWTDFPFSTGYRYRWLLDGVAADGAVGQTYTPRGGEENRQLSCEVTAQNAAGQSDAATSAARQVAPAPPPTCEELGNCPRPTCEELGNCPRPTCEELGNCPRPTCEELGNCPRPTCEQLGNCPPLPCRVNCGGGGQTPQAPSNEFSIAGKSASASAITFRIRLPAPGSVRIAASTRSGRRAFNAGSARATGRSAGVVTVRVALSAAAKKALQRARGKRLSVSVRITFTPTGGTARTVTQTVVVRAARRGRRA